MIEVDYICCLTTMKRLGLNNFQQQKGNTATLGNT